ncbi:copper chaperone PCu(A)C [Sagittula salina]|uniref:Copper chaperone PCu(A)C n=1 Tax=Sagittula salina TaxID=2820268 RepID=A0A940MLH1_9RHOB|nr:copper chaperone PCu(A)C [Sagittula salina]MBP0484015.1 copper chaperone PCu(A)C [Sagittula salina]
MMKFLLPGAAALAFAVPAGADITIHDAYARSAGAMARSGAAFFVIENDGAEDDRLLSAASDSAKLVELHTHMEIGDGVMKMTEVPEGFVVPAGGTHALARGGDHVMLMGLKKPMEQGDSVTVTLTFEKAGEMVVEIPVDLDRQDGMGGGMGAGMGHGAGHGAMKMGN